MLVASALFRCKYYFAWYLGEAGLIAAGIGYNGFEVKDGKKVIKWDKAVNCYPIKCEFGENVKSITDNWNICTAKWLKNYVYLRISPPGTKPSMLANYGTYFVSAFWHGFYPGYYVFFIYSAVLTEIARSTFFF